MTANRSPLVALTLLLTLPLHAQDAPKPAPQLQKLKALEGQWQGSGTARMQAGAPATKWKAVSHYQWVLGGFWLQCDTAVDFEGMPAMRLREYLGWDGENQRYVNLAVGNTGDASLNTVHLGDDEMVTFMHWVRQGKPEIERARTKFSGDHMDFSISFLHSAGSADDAVTGVMHKVAKVDMPALSAAKGMVAAGPEMTKMGRMVGTFDGVGEMIMAPGAPPMKIKGRDVATALFDGHIVMIETHGSSDGGPYEAHGFYAWSAGDRCYKALTVDNMGMICAMDGQLGDDAFICTFSGLRMGQPCVARTVVSIDKSGKPTKIVNHSCMGSAPPMQDFTLTYAPSK